MTGELRLHELRVSNTIGNLSRAISGIKAGRVHPSSKPALENELVIVKRQLAEHIAIRDKSTPKPVLTFSRTAVCTPSQPCVGVRTKFPDSKKSNKITSFAILDSTPSNKVISNVISKKASNAVSIPQTQIRTATNENNSSPLLPIGLGIALVMIL